MDNAQVDGFVTIRVPDGDVVYVDKNELGIDWVDRVDDEVDSGKSTSTSHSGNRVDTVKQLEADESTSTVQSGNRVTLNNLTYAQRAEIPSTVHPRPIRPQRAYFYPGHEGCHCLPLKPSQKDNDVLSINEKRAITRVHLWLRAIVQAQKNDLWDMPDRHDLNSAKGNFILCRNDFTGIVSGYGGAAFGIYGMIGRWTLVNGKHWLSAQKKDTGLVCKELYDQVRTPGADFKFKSIFAWPNGTAGPEEMHCQLGEGIGVIMLDLLSRTPATHHLRNRAYHERIRMKANDIIEQWDNDDTFGFKIGPLPVVRTSLVWAVD